MIATFLDDIFAELEQREVEVSVYARGQNGQHYQVTVSLGYSLHGSSYGKPRIAVDGVGPTFRAAMQSAYDQLTGLVDMLEAKPVEEPPLRATASDDDIPF